MSVFWIAAFLALQVSKKCLRNSTFKNPNFISVHIRFNSAFTNVWHTVLLCSKFDYWTDFHIGLCARNKRKELAGD